MKILFLLLTSLTFCYSHNFLVVSPVFGYSHMKFMNKVADTLANGDHNVTILQTYNYEHFGKIRMAKNTNVEILDYHLDESKAVSNENSASAFKYMWNTEIINNPITGAIAVGLWILIPKYHSFISDFNSSIWRNEDNV